MPRREIVITILICLCARPDSSSGHSPSQPGKSRPHRRTASRKAKTPPAQQDRGCLVLPNYLVRVPVMAVACVLVDLDGLVHDRGLYC